MDKLVAFSGNHALLVLAFLVSFFLLLATELRRKASGMTNIDPLGAVSLINSEAVVVDLRNPEAYSRGHIVNARNIPFDEFDVDRDKVSKLKGKSVIAVCDTGISSTKAVGLLRKSGFENVFGLKGGMSAWSAAGLPVVTGKKTKSKG
ncbi:MAG: rhodanese-like domain-containing protein [Woeseiaceae bacterium]